MRFPRERNIDVYFRLRKALQAVKDKGERVTLVQSPG